MRTPLKKFTDFTNALLPHETMYLLSVQSFSCSDRLKILELVDYNAQNIDQFTPYDNSIDKRKYNHLQNWISTRLKSIDTDEQFCKMLRWEKAINTDSIQIEDEKELLKSIRRYVHPGYYFTKFYELVEHYRHFLLIRLRYRDHQLTDDFLKKYKADYLQSRQIKDQLHEASKEIVGHYSGKDDDSKQWKGWLSELFYNESLEGQIRYMALVRQVFISHNYRQYDLLREQFDYWDRKFSEGIYYSKRLLINYYSNRLMLHSNFKEYDKAVYYGYLSVKAKTHDHLFYVNNLCAVLLRLNRNWEALQLMKGALTEAKKTKNFHNRIGFVSFYMEALIKNGLVKNAIQYGDSFLRGYTNEILQYRWHLFFTVYLEAMFHQKEFEKLIKVARRYRLRERDNAYQSSANYLPMIPLYISSSEFAEGNITRDKYFKILDKFYQTYSLDNNATFNETLEGMKLTVPDISNYMRGMVV